LLHCSFLNFLPSVKRPSGGLLVLLSARSGYRFVRLSGSRDVAAREVLAMGIVGTLILLALFGLCFLFIEWEDHL